MISMIIVNIFTVIFRVGFFFMLLLFLGQYKVLYVYNCILSRSEDVFSKQE